MNTLKDVDKSKELAEFQGEERRLQVQVEEMKKKCNSISEIFNKVATAKPQKKIETIDGLRPQMLEIEGEIDKIESFIDKQSKRYNDALYNTIMIDGL